MYVFFQRKVILDVALQMLMLNIYNQITEGKKHPFLFEAEKGVKVTREAKENALRIESESPGSAYAVVASSFIYQKIANFYLKTKKKTRPYKVFSKREDAIIWLKNYI